MCLNNYTKWLELLVKYSDFPAREVNYLMTKINHGRARGANRAHYRPQKNVRFVNHGKTTEMWRPAVVHRQLAF
jgi:hypothetical protein